MEIATGIENTVIVKKTNNVFTQNCPLMGLSLH